MKEMGPCGIFHTLLPSVYAEKVAIQTDGRSERIRTSDPLIPNQVRYQAALRSVPISEVEPIAFVRMAIA